jgi:hypothetical protein
MIIYHQHEILDHHALYLNFGTLAGLWPWAVGTSLKIEVLGFFIITMKFLIQRA